MRASNRALAAAFSPAGSDAGKNQDALHPLFPGKSGISLAALVVVNLIPLAGVVLWDWDVASLVILYWSENIVIGVCTLVKILTHNPLLGVPAGGFFIVHYGGFCAVHGLFVLALTMDTPPPFLEGDPWPLFLIFVQLLVEVVGNVLAMAPPEWMLGVVALSASHGISLVLNYYRGGEYRAQTMQSLMSAPYKRIVILHIAIIAGGFGVMTLGSPIALLLLLVVLKLGLDVWLHLRERQQAPF